MRDMNDMVFFDAVIRQQGFSAAARSLNVPKSTVSRHVKRLEDRLGVRLLERSTRKMNLTEAGRAYYLRITSILTDLDAAEGNLKDNGAAPSGTVRVSCPIGVTSVLAKVIPGFMARYSEIRVQVIATNRRVDLIAERIDIAIRARSHFQNESLIMRTLGTARMIFVASEGFAKRHRLPSNPTQLKALPFLALSEDPPPHKWKLVCQRRPAITLKLDPVLSTSDFNILTDAACAGAGIALLPAPVVSRYIEQGRLVHLLPQWFSEEVTIHLVYLSRLSPTAGCRAFINYLVTHYSLMADAT